MVALALTELCGKNPTVLVTSTGRCALTAVAALGPTEEAQEDSPHSVPRRDPYRR
jgi:hypothetical protein